MTEKTLLRLAIAKHYGSISEAARRMKIDGGYLGKIVRGDRQPTAAVAETIGKMCGVGIQAVLGPEPPAETRSERMARRRRADKKLLAGLARVHKTPAFRAKMRAANAVKVGARKNS